MVLAVGDEAPMFELETSEGVRIRRADLKGRPTVLYFYPKNFTLTCTREACLFRDAHERLEKRNVKIIGISADSKESHQRFRAMYNLPFPLVSDPALSLARSFGAVSFLHTLVGVPKRVTFLLDRNGLVWEVILSELFARAHVDGVCAALDRMDRAHRLNDPTPKGHLPPEIARAKVTTPSR